MKDFLLGLAYLVGVLLVLRLIGRLLIKWVYWPLEKFCGERGLNPSPWGFTIWEGIMVYEYLSRTGYELFFKNWIYSRWMTSAGYGWAILALAALPMVVMLVQSRVIYFIPWLLVPFVLTVIAWCATTAGLVPPVHVVVPWVVPPVIYAFLATGGSFAAAVLSAINLAIGVAIWAVFVVMANRLSVDVEETE
ncbi:MAG: hypothetical protein RR528_06685, partial [Angelakisella sp.]